MTEKRPTGEFLIVGERVGENGWTEELHIAQLEPVKGQGKLRTAWGNVLGKLNQRNQKVNDLKSGR